MQRWRFGECVLLCSECVSMNVSGECGTLFCSRPSMWLGCWFLWSVPELSRGRGGGYHQSGTCMHLPLVSYSCINIFLLWPLLLLIPQQTLPVSSPLLLLYLHLMLHTTARLHASHPKGSLDSLCHIIYNEDSSAWTAEQRWVMRDISKLPGTSHFRTLAFS